MKPRPTPLFCYPKLLGCLLLTLALLFCAGCGQSTDPTVLPDAASSSGAPQVQEPEIPETDLDPVTLLSDLSPDHFPSLGALGQETVLVCWNETEAEGQPSNTRCVILDVVQDKILRSATLKGGFSLQRTFSDGTALMINYERDQFYLLDQHLRVTPLDVPVGGGQFSQDHSSYYFTDQDVLYQYDLETGSQTQVSLGSGLRLNGISGIHPTQNCLTGWIYPSLYSHESCPALIDWESGEPLLLQEGLNLPYFYGQNFQSRWNNYETGENYLIWGELESDAPLCCVNLNQLEDESTFLYPLADSSYALQVYDASWQESSSREDNQRITLYRLETDGLSCCPLDSLGLEGAVSASVYLPDASLILSCVYHQNGYQLYRINPEAMDFSPAEIPLSDPPQRIDQQLWQKCLAELESPELSPDLSGVRARADQLEAQYDIHILLSAQCADPCDASGYTVTTSDQAGWKNEALSISRALNGVEEALANYPQGFFSQFCSESQGSGIYLMLVGPIGSSDPINVAAFQYGVGSREYIGLDISFYELKGNLYHEIWHATENKILNSDFMGFYDGSWDSCNPEGFEYRNEYNLSDPDGTLWRWTYLGGEDPFYFVDDYSKTFAKEDRARIMEYVMGDDGLSQAVLTSPAIRQKLQLMDQGIRAAFDTTGWDEVRWLRFE